MTMACLKRLQVFEGILPVRAREASMNIGVRRGTTALANKDYVTWSS